MPLNRFKTDIKLERRRRNQVYLALDYVLERVTYFDFFSSDAFHIAKYSKAFAQIFEKKEITSELLLFPFFYCESNLLNLLEEYNLSSLFLEFLSQQFDTELTLNKNEIQKKLGNIVYDENISYSNEVNYLFEKASENALKRFKTPIITSEILFLTMMEEKNVKVSKIIKKILKTNIEWQLLKYRLLKKLHSNEAFIRSEVNRNQHYFTYLLKSELPEEQFSKLIENKTLGEGVQLFRNIIINDVLEVNIYQILLKDIKNSMKINTERTYS
jgi:hypothetical protein